MCGADVLQAGCASCFPTKALKETLQPLKLVLLPAYWHSDVNNLNLTFINSSVTVTYRLSEV